VSSTGSGKEIAIFFIGIGSSVWRKQDALSVFLEASQYSLVFIPFPSLPLQVNQLRVNAVGGFPEPIYAALSQDRPLLIAIVKQIMEDHFSVTLHDRILEAVGLDLHQVAGSF
jgi:hypothetical protein